MKYRKVSELSDNERNKLTLLLINGLSTEHISERLNVYPDDINTVKEAYIRFKLQFEGEVVI